MNNIHLLTNFSIIAFSGAVFQTVMVVVPHMLKKAGNIYTTDFPAFT